MFLLQQVIQEAKFEEKYGANVKVDPDTGEVSVTSHFNRHCDAWVHQFSKNLGVT